MTCTLWLLRHAKSAWDTPAPSDYERPLAKRGRRDAPRIGQWLTEHAVDVDAVYCSSARRARQTLAGALEQWSIDAARIDYRDDLYHSGVRHMLGLVAESPPGHRSIMLVGHNPGMDGLLTYLCGEELPYTNTGKLMTTAALAQIELAEWSAHGGRLQSLIRPRELH